MHVVSIRYTRKPGEEFDFNHWANTHMPMGIGIFKKVNGIAPKQIMIQHDTFGLDGKPHSTDAYATVWLVFETRAGLEGFMRLHNDPVASAPLAADFKNYAPAPPHLALGELTVFEDINAILARAAEILR